MRAPAFLLCSLLSVSATGVQSHAAQLPYRIVEVAAGLAYPWGLVFLPGGDLLVSEKPGSIRRIRAGRLDPKPLAGVPATYFDGDGGLLGLALHPKFASNRLLYLCLAVGDEQANTTRVIRARLDEERLVEPQTIFSAVPLKKGASHYGCRLLFAPDGTLLVTLGDGYDYLWRAQHLDTHFGKIVRLEDDGRVPALNPFVGRPGARPEIYTWGHRNVQGIALRPGTSEIWIHEHGPKGGDEVNVLRPGANYGWPAITHGIDYSGAIISDRTEAPGMEQPVVYWVPSIAPSGMDFYDGAAFPQWSGDLFVGALAAKELRRIDLEGRRVAGQESLLGELGKRIREVRSGPDGFLYVATDEPEGKLLRLEPAH